DYLSCASKAFEQVTRLLVGQRIAAPFRYVTNAFLAVCLALLGNFGLMSLQRRKKIAPENALNVKVVVNAASSAIKAGAVAGVALTMLSQRKTKHVESSSSGGGRSGGGGGGHSSGGGGGFSGGGGGHRF
ncbi:MAG: TPM domain-containing protein, partial [Clostridia bacterium]|nr:TPM domain-containing protein [Clostridia bacterium]